MVVRDGVFSILNLEGSVMNSLKTCVRSLICGMFVCGVAGAATVSIGDFSVPAPAGTLNVPVSVSGGELLTDLAAIIVVGDGGTILGNPAVPPVTAISYAGSIWNGAAGGFTESGTTTGEIAFSNVSLNTLGQSVAANGLLLTFTLDLTGFPAGSTFPLSLSLPGQQDTQFTQFNVGVITPTFNDGVVQIVPEPAAASLAVLALSALAVARRRRRA
jgi:hypothetical protein